MTPQAIREGFQNLRDGSEMAGLADAARSRSESDWLIGINGTRAITKRMFGSRGRNVASVGRVQTPTLAMVYARELEIRNFKPHDYWRVTAKFGITQGIFDKCDCTSSNYNALQLRAQKRLGTNYTVLASFTYSKTMDFGEFGTPTDQYNARLDYGPASFDREFVFTLAHTVYLPFGRGRRSVNTWR